MTTLFTGYAALLTSLSASYAATEQAGTGYARVPVTVSYDPIANVATILNGMTFTNTGGGAWTANSNLVFYDASSGGNLIATAPISSTVAANSNLSYPPQMTFSPLPAYGSVAQGASLGSLLGQPLTAGVALTFTAGVLAAGVGATQAAWNSNSAPPTTIAAAGSNQGGATLVPARRTTVTVTASTEGVILKLVATGAETGVNVPGTVGVKVYPPVGCTLDALSTNTAVVLAAGKGSIYEQISATKFITKLKGA